MLTHGADELRDKMPPPCADEHADGLGGGLDDGGSAHDERTERDGCPPARAIGDVGCERICS